MQIPPSEQLRFWAHELGGMAKTGLLFVANDYDRDRYERTLVIAEALAGLTIAADFTPERPYLPDVGIPTPKIGCSVAAFDDAGRVALIQRADNKRWALPGGMAEIGSPPSENALRELREETGFAAAIERLVGIYDNKRFASVSPYQFYICLFRARINGGVVTTSAETLEVRLVDPTDLPSDMSELQRAMLSDAASPPPQAVFQ
jgi:ADP-ribose pyrophosphatase YjhB (NUDIX family)